MGSDYPPRGGVVPEMASEEARAILRLAAEPWSVADNTKSLIARAARVLRLSYRRASAIWYGEALWPIKPEDAARLRAEKARLLRLREVRLGREIEQTRREIEEALRRENALAAARAVAEPDGEMGLPLGPGGPA